LSLGITGNHHFLYDLHEYSHNLFCLFKLKIGFESLFFYLSFLRASPRSQLVQGRVLEQFPTHWCSCLADPNP
ncbi:mCG142738, partial [Mus musculus]